MLENPFTFHLITQLLALLATVMLLFRGPQNSSRNTWIANVENKQKSSEVSEVKVRWKLLLYLFSRSEMERLFSFSQSSEQACLSHATFCAHRNGEV